MTIQEVLKAKIVILGEPAVGKTSLRVNYLGSELSGNYVVSLGADSIETRIQVASNVILDMSIWDIAGQENFLPMTKEFLQGAQGAILVFDLTRTDTFDKITTWLDILHGENPLMDRNIPFLVVGNKEDLDIFIKVKDDDVNLLLDYFNRHTVYSKTLAEYIKTSAKTGSGVKTAFHRLSEIIIKNFELVEGRKIMVEKVEVPETFDKEPYDVLVSDSDGEKSIEEIDVFNDSGQNDVSKGHQEILTSQSSLGDEISKETFQNSYSHKTEDINDDGIKLQDDSNPQSKERNTSVNGVSSTDLARSTQNQSRGVITQKPFFESKRYRDEPESTDKNEKKVEEQVSEDDKDPSPSDKQSKNGEDIKRIETENNKNETNI